MYLVLTCVSALAYRPRPDVTPSCDVGSRLPWPLSDSVPADASTRRRRSAVERVRRQTIGSVTGGRKRCRRLRAGDRSIPLRRRGPPAVCRAAVAERRASTRSADASTVDRVRSLIAQLWRGASEAFGRRDQAGVSRSQDAFDAPRRQIRRSSLSDPRTNRRPSQAPLCTSERLNAGVVCGRRAPLGRVFDARQDRWHDAEAAGDV